MDQELLDDIEKFKTAAENWLMGEPVPFWKDSRKDSQQQPQELCVINTLPAIKFLAVAGMGFMAGGALTISGPFASALLVGM